MDLKDKLIASFMAFENKGNSIWIQKFMKSEQPPFKILSSPVFLQGKTKNGNTRL